MKFTFYDGVQIASSLIVVSVCVWYEISWLWILPLAFLASFVPMIPIALYKGFLAFKKEWNDPKYSINEGGKK